MSIKPIISKDKLIQDNKNAYVVPADSKLCAL